MQAYGFARNVHASVGTTRFAAARQFRHACGCDVRFRIQLAHHIVQQRGGKFLLYQQIHRAMLQALKAADGLTKLHARFHVIDGGGERA